MQRVSVVNSAFRAALLLIALASPLAAQSEKKPLELRVQLAGVTVGENFTSASVSLPGAFAFAWYLSPRVAIEPRLQLSFSSVEVASGDKRNVGALSVGAFLPLYLRADGGRSGLFIAPGIAIAEPFGDIDAPRVVQGGVDVGLKRRLGERMATRWAVELRDYDNSDELTVGASFGLSFFWR